MDLHNVLKNVAGDYEALGLDLFDILKMVRKPKVIEADITDLKRSLDNARKTIDEMLKKLEIESEEK